MQRLEAYLLNTGKFRLYFRKYFVRRYQVDIGRVMIQFQLLSLVDRAEHPYNMFIVFARVYAWSFDYFKKVIDVMFYLDLIEAEYSDGNDLLKLKGVQEVVGA